MISFFENFGEQLPDPRTSCVPPASAACSPALMKPSLTDEDREAAIERAGKLIESSMAEWDESGCFAARGRAERARMLMEALIRGRSPERVAQMEHERGLL